MGDGLPGRSGMPVLSRAALESGHVVARALIRVRSGAEVTARDNT